MRLLNILSAVALIQLVPLTAYAQSQPSYSDPATQVVAAKLMSNYSDGNFYPKEFITRGQLAQIMVKTFRLDKRIASRKPDVIVGDVSSSNPAYKEIQLVLKNDIMKGYRGNLFFPNQKVTRAEALAIFAQAYGVFQFPDNTVTEILAAYPDAKSIPTWARKAIATVVAEGFINPDPSGNISPLQPMTRGDMAFLLSKYLQRSL